MIVRQPVKLTGAGRTDTGVHGWGQVVSLDLHDDCDLANELSHYAEVTIATDLKRVTITWYAAEHDTWTETATASGTHELTVDQPFPFHVIPDTLLD